MSYNYYYYNIKEMLNLRVLKNFKELNLNELP